MRLLVNFLLLYVGNARTELALQVPTLQDLDVSAAVVTICIDCAWTRVIVTFRPVLSFLNNACDAELPADAHACDVVPSCFAFALQTPGNLVTTETALLHTVA